jgi:ribosomal protein L37AE/L43A
MSVMPVKKDSILITCPTCGHMVYGRLWRCPDCGASQYNKPGSGAKPPQESGSTTTAALRERLKNK